MKSKINYLSLPITGILFFFLACSSGGSGGTGPVEGGNQDLGASAQGYVLFLVGGKTRIINLSNKLSVEYPKYGNLLWPSYDEKEWLAVSSDKRSSEGVDEFLIHDGGLNVIKTSQVSESIQGYAKLSPDKTMIAAFWSDEANGELYGSPTFTIFNREGTPLFRAPNVTSFVWTHKGEMVLAQGNRIYLIKDFSGQATFIKEVSKDVFTMAISPDDTKLALSIEGDNTRESHVWLLNMDGSDLRQLTTSTLNEMDAVWVGDTGWLLLRSSVSVSTPGYNGCPKLIFANSAATGLIDVDVVSGPHPDFQVVKYREANSDSDLPSCPFSPPVWFAGK